jgi:hypothetical protein
MTCRKCGSEIDHPEGGRPSRWCGPGCALSGEAEMRRVNQLLKVLENGLAVDRLNGLDTARREQIISELQAKYDHLAGVPI